MYKLFILTCLLNQITCWIWTILVSESQSGCIVQVSLYVGVWVSGTTSSVDVYRASNISTRSSSQPNAGQQTLILAFFALFTTVHTKPPKGSCCHLTTISRLLKLINRLNIKEVYIIYVGEGWQRKWGGISFYFLHTKIGWQNNRHTHIAGVIFFLHFFDAFLQPPSQP